MTAAKKIYHDISSMKTGLILLVLVGLVSAVGSAVFPEGFSDTIVFKLLLLLLLLNMILCTINRIFWLKTVHLSGRKNRRGLPRQLGILLLHAGIIFILAGGTVFVCYGQNVEINLAYGEAVDLSKVMHLDNSISIKLNTFKISLNKDGTPSQYYSNVSVFEAGKIRKKQTISVNHPLKYQKIKAYQESYGYRVKASTVTGSEKGQQLLKEGEYLKIPGTKRVVKIYRYFSDFDPAKGMNQASMKGGNPRIIYSVYENNQLLGVGAAKFGNKIEIDKSKYFVFNGVEPYTVLKIKSDPGLTLVLMGALLFIAGVSMALFVAPVRQNPYHHDPKDQYI